MLRVRMLKDNQLLKQRIAVAMTGQIGDVSAVAGMLTAESRCLGRTSSTDQAEQSRRHSALAFEKALP